MTQLFQKTFGYVADEMFLVFNLIFLTIQHIFDFTQYIEINRLFSIMICPFELNMVFLQYDWLFT